MYLKIGGMCYCGTWYCYGRHVSCTFVVPSLYISSIVTFLMYFCGTSVVHHVALCNSVVHHCFLMHLCGTTEVHPVAILAGLMYIAQDCCTADVLLMYLFRNYISIMRICSTMMVLRPNFMVLVVFVDVLFTQSACTFRVNSVALSDW